MDTFRAAVSTEAHVEALGQDSFAHPFMTVITDVTRESPCTAEGTAKQTFCRVPGRRTAKPAIFRHFFHQKQALLVEWNVMEEAQPPQWELGSLAPVPHR